MGPPGGGAGLCLREPGARRGPRYGAAPGRAGVAAPGERGLAGGPGPGAAGRAGPGSRGGQGRSRGSGWGGACRAVPPPRCESPPGTGRLGRLSLRERCPFPGPGSGPARAGPRNLRQALLDRGGPVREPRRMVVLGNSQFVRHGAGPTRGRCQPRGRALLHGASRAPAGAVSLGIPLIPSRSPGALSDTCVRLACRKGKGGFPPAVNVTHREHQGGFPGSGFCAWGGKGMALHF